MIEDLKDLSAVEQLKSRGKAELKEASEKALKKHCVIVRLADVGVLFLTNVFFILSLIFWL